VNEQKCACVLSFAKKQDLQSWLGNIEKTMTGNVPQISFFILKITYCHSSRETEKVVRFSNARNEKI